MGRAGRLLAGAVAGVGLAVLLVAPAAADPARPTRFRSQVEEVVPRTDAIEVRVLGGDAFLELRVRRGATVVVEGYEREPWLRVLPDGTVAQNVRSRATYLNNERYGRVGMPTEGVGPELEPEWEQVASGGVHAWHDHRVHWMQLDPPDDTTARPDGSRHVQDWTVPMTVDGEPVEVRGELVLLPPVVPVDGAVAGAVTAVGLVLAGRRRPGLVAAVAAVVGAAVALVLGAAELRLQPPGAGASVLPVVLPAVALVAGVAALVPRLRRAGGLPVALLAAVAVLSGWAAMRLPVLWHPELPTEVAPVVERVAVGAVLAVCVVGAVLAVRSAGAAAARPATGGGAS